MQKPFLGYCPNYIMKKENYIARGWLYCDLEVVKEVEVYCSWLVCIAIESNRIAEIEAWWAG